MKNKLFIYGLIATACYLTYKFGDPLVVEQTTKTVKQKHNYVVKIISKEYRMFQMSNEPVINTDLGEFTFVDKTLYTNVEQGCTYKIWISRIGKITAVEHVIDDGCTRYHPDSEHKF